MVLKLELKKIIKKFMNQKLQLKHSQIFVKKRIINLMKKRVFNLVILE